MSVTGPATLAVGEVVQFGVAATLIDGRTEVLGAAGLATAVWTSSNDSVFTVASGGAATATGTGVATVRVSYAGKNGSLGVSVSQAGLISSCGSYSASVAYRVEADLSSSAAACLNFSGAKGAQLDCQQHDVSSIALSGVVTFAVRNCHMNVGAAVALRATASTQVTVTASATVGQVEVYGCQHCTFMGNTFVFPSVACVAGENSLVPGEVLLYGGQDNIIEGNTIDAGWDGSFGDPDPASGCDDGLLIEGEANSQIQNNSIRNAYDAGIEGVNSNVVPLSTSIQDNRISRTGYTGIGGYYICGWQNSLFLRNTVVGSPSLIVFDHDKNSPSAVTAMTLVNNQFIGNSLVSPSMLPPRYGGDVAPAMIVDYVAGGLPSTVSGNLIRGNDFGTSSPGPVLLPAEGFIDGGGNICARSSALACVPGAAAPGTPALGGAATPQRK